MTNEKSLLKELACNISALTDHIFRIVAMTGGMVFWYYGAHTDAMIALLLAIAIRPGGKA